MGMRRLKYGRFGRFCSTDTPTELPTWCDIGKLRIRFRHAYRNWAFFKTARDAAYENLPTRTSRNYSRRRYGARRITDSEDSFRAPYFSGADIVRCNICALIVAEIMNICIGAHLAKFFEAYGFPTPDPLRRMGIRIERGSYTLPGVLIKKKRMASGRPASYLAL